MTIRQRGRRGNQLEAERREWRQHIKNLWGPSCVYPLGGCQGPIEIAHAYGKGAHAEWHVEPWNGFPACVYHHRMAPANFEFTPHLKRALQRCADAVRDGMEGRAEMPTRRDLQHLLMEAIKEKAHGAAESQGNRP